MQSQHMLSLLKHLSFIYVTGTYEVTIDIDRKRLMASKIDTTNTIRMISVFRHMEDYIPYVEISLPERKLK